ncbi:MAG: hypothetical protein FWE74_04145 [Oscillospiraceae bacterium]|nr:hypothetical protein [Oscillospiraceae bacterium]
MKKLLTFLIAAVFVFSLAMPAGASLPNVDLGREIKIGDDSAGNIIKKAGITLTRSQFELIEEELSDRMNTIEIAQNTLARFIIMDVKFDDEVGDFIKYENEMRSTANRAPLQEYERFIADFNNWLQPRQAKIDEGIVKMFRFDIEDLFVENDDGRGFIENMHGGSLNLLIEIPAEMRGNYEYFVIGETYSYNQERNIFITANNGNALPVTNNYITATLRGLGKFVLAAVPKDTPPPNPLPPHPPPPEPEPEPQPEAPLTTTDALNILRHVAGVSQLTNEQRARYNLSSSITTADALAILRQVAGM